VETYGQFKAHPAADIFPLLEGKPFDELVQSIKDHGQLELIGVLIGTDQILDGRNRYRACLAAGVEPKWFYKALMGIGPWEYVIVQNLRRRHLTREQAKSIALAMLPHVEAEARQRMLAGKADPEAKVPQGRAPQAADIVGSAVGVTGRTVRNWKAKVIERPSPPRLASNSIPTKADAKDAALSWMQIAQAVEATLEIGFEPNLSAKDREHVVRQFAAAHQFLTKG